MPPAPERIRALIPAGGTGRRLGDVRPKQYLDLGGRTMLEWSVARLLERSWISQVLVVCAPDDPQAQTLFENVDRVLVMPRGGATRRDTVLGGLRALREREPDCDGDWILVHDAARPGVGAIELDRLRAVLMGAEDTPPPDCALLAVPVADTVKRARPGSAEVAETLDRTELWLAQTPQAGRVGALIAALEAKSDATDEASAIEAAGGRVRLVEGSSSNFKVTTRADLEQMRQRLEAR
ncbi:MAG: 2-C-methyl-D-erythritol 4-phosphate cytidylyltransferase [Pseudomonadota bacterium]|jgi:2-C-methyl-D-erythritol 4-phosphate cytidylyltransferase